MEHNDISNAEEANKMEEDGEETSMSFYTLPNYRFTIFMQVLLVLDLASSVTLWLCGGHNKYMEDHVIHFTIRDSVIDLAALAFVRCGLLFFIYGSLENISLKQIDQPFESSLSIKKCIWHVIILFFSIGSLAFSITKGVLIYNVRSDSAHHLHPTYYALVISALCFCFLESVGAVLSFHAMHKLKVMRILHTPNDKDKKPKKKVDLSRLATLTKPESCIIFIASLALLVSTGSQIAAPYFFGMVISSAMEPGMEHLNKTILILLGIYIGGAIASMIRAWLYTLSGQRIVARIRKQLFNAIMRQEVAFFDTNRTGELINRLSSDTQVIQNALTVNISMLLRYILQILGSIVFMFTLSAKLTGVLISVVPIIGVGAQQYGKFVQGISKQYQDKLAEASAVAEESVGNIRTVRSFSQEPKTMDKYAEGIHKSYLLGAKLAVASGAFSGIVMSIAQAAIVLVLWYGGKLVNEGDLNVGILTAFMLYTLNVAMSFAFLSSLYGDFMKAVGASQRMFELFDRVPEISIEGGYELASLNDSIVFDDVGFHYPTRPDTDVLKGLSFKIEPGETVALVGPSGGGKSTVISLLERFYDPIRGKICIGNVEISTLDLSWYRKKLALVSQEPVLFATTIAENIAYGKDATQDEIEEAAQQANAHDFIMSFDEGYQTQVGERGITLSGGQKQRVAIARALLMDPQILLLDEATSALDAESEHFVQEAIDRAMVNRTVLVIAHRLSTVRNADLVLVMEKGSIVERGNHDSLIAQNGVYKKLVLRQLTSSSGTIQEQD